MKRLAFKMKLKAGCEAEYKKRHDEIWPELKWVRGQTPTPQGTISVNFNIKTGVASFTVLPGH